MISTRTEQDEMAFKFIVNTVRKLYTGFIIKVLAKKYGRDIRKSIMLQKLGNLLRISGARKQRGWLERKWECLTPLCILWLFSFVLSEHRMCLW